MSHLNIAFDRFASIGTIMHYILVISQLKKAKVTQLHLQYGFSVFFSIFFLN